MFVVGIDVAAAVAVAVDFHRLDSSLVVEHKLFAQCSVLSGVGFHSHVYKYLYT